MAIGVFVKIILSYALKKVDVDFVDWSQLSTDSKVRSLVKKRKCLFEFCKKQNVCCLTQRLFGFSRIMFHGIN